MGSRATVGQSASRHTMRASCSGRSSSRAACDSSSAPRALASMCGRDGPADDSGRAADRWRSPGVDAVRISSSGELPPPPDRDKASEISTGSIDRFGRAALSLTLALDNSPGPLEHGPDAYIGLAGNILPGWALALVALALLFPVAAVAAQGVGSSARSPLEAARSLGWVARAALPFLAALLVLYVLDVFGVVPDPPFPFDPQAQELGLGGRLGVLAALVAFVAGFWLLRPLRPPPAAAAAPAAPAALALAALCVLLVWFLNPYLALLLALGLNFWVFAALPTMPGRLAAFALVALGFVPLLFAIGDLAGRLGGGSGVARDLVLMVADGQIGSGLAILGCLLAGTGTAIVALAGPATSPPAPEIRIRAPRFGLRRRRRKAREREAPAESAPEPGDPIHLLGPGGGYSPDPDARWHLFAGDTSALPAIAGALEELRSTCPDARGHAVIEVHGRRGAAVARGRPRASSSTGSTAAGRPGDALVGAVRALAWKDDGAGVRARRGRVRRSDLRRHLRVDRGCRERAAVDLRLLAPRRHRRGLAGGQAGLAPGDRGVRDRARLSRGPTYQA